MEDSYTQLTEYIERITTQMGIACTIAVAPEENHLNIAITSSEGGRYLIGKGGQTMKALEHIVRAAWARMQPGGPSIILDVNDYRREKQEELVQMVRTAIERVRNTNRPEALPPMSAYERRLVHTELAAYTDVGSESVGQEPYRRVVIKPQ